jgi:glycosyltransferase
MKKRNPKISIITVVKNGMPYLSDSINSFLRQNYLNKELIIIYSKSSDLTLEYLSKINNKNIKIFIDKYSANKFGSLNFGIKKAKGDILGLLHSDDIFYSNEILKDVANAYKKNFFDLCYGDVLFSSRNNLFLITRFWKSELFLSYKLFFGWMPPHTSIFLAKNIYKKFYYSTLYNISSDYDYILRILRYCKKIIYIKQITTIMRSGGDSTKNIVNIFKKILEDIKILNNFYSFYKIPLIIFFKSFSKINQIFYSYKLKINNYLNLFNNKINIKVLENISDKIFKNNFVIIGLNLACLSYILIKNVKYIKNKYIFFWPDGFFANLFINSKVIPGRDFLNKIQNNNNFDFVYLIGTYDERKINYLKNKFVNKLVFSIDVQKTNVSNIINTIQKVRFKKKSLIFINLPTPKQELVAFFIMQNSKYFKIVCSGGAIDYNSGLHVPPPTIINRFFLESIWRLRYDFFRRLYRLISTLWIFIINYFLKNYDQFYFKKI